MEGTTGTRRCNNCDGTGRDGFGESCIPCWGTGVVSECHGEPVDDGRCHLCDRQVEEG